MGIRALQPNEQGLHQPPHSIGRWGEMDDAVPLCDADRAGAKTAWGIHKSCHEKAVGGEEVFYGMRVPFLHGFIGGEGILHLMDFRWFAEYAFPGDDRCDLIQGECIVLDGERCVDGLDAVITAKFWHVA